MDKKLIFAGAFGLLFLGVLIWFLFFRKNPTTNTTIITLGKKDDKPAQATKTITNTVYVNSGGGGDGNARNDNFPLKQGSYGEKVKQVQTKLGISADGDWGRGTQAALVKAGINNGFADENALNKWLNPTSTPDTTGANTTALSTMNGGFVPRDDNYRGKWANSEAVSVYEDAYITSKVLNGFNPLSSFFGLGVVKNNFLWVMYGGRSVFTGGKKGWVQLSQLTQTEKPGLFDPFDEENQEKNQKRRNTRKKY